MSSASFGEHKKGIGPRPKGYLGKYAGFGRDLAMLGAGAVVSPYLLAPLVTGFISAPISTTLGFIGGDVGSNID